jgi:hypothetical protein
MSKPIEEMAAVLWEAMLRQIETRIEERIAAAITNIAKGPIPGPERTKPRESVHGDRPDVGLILIRAIGADDHAPKLCCIEMIVSK